MYLSRTCPHCGNGIEISLKEVGIGKAPPSQVQQTQPSGLEELLESINTDGLKENERNFVNDMRERFAKYGNTTRVTEKQIGWLRNIAEGGF